MLTKKKGKFVFKNNVDSSSRLSKLSVCFCAQLVFDAAFFDALPGLTELRADGLTVRQPCSTQASQPKLFDLKTLTLSNCEGLNDDDLLSLVAVCPNVVNLDLSFNATISAGALVSACGKGRQLTTVRLVGKRTNRFCFDLIEEK